MARRKQFLADGVRLSDFIGTSIMAEVLPMAVVRAALAKHGRLTLRQRKLPREFLVYYVVAMALYANVNLRSVLQALLEGLTAFFPSLCRLAACDAAISQGRERLGEAVMRDLAETVCRPIATDKTIGAWYKSWRLMAIDGSDFDLPDEAAITREFPKHSNGVEYPFPQLRFVALVELGTRCMCAITQGNDRDSEKKLATQVISCLQPGMLLLGDRYYMGYDLYTQVVATGAAVLFRAQANFKLTPIEHLPDGSYLAKIYRDRKDRRHDDGVVVRVIEYRVTENGQPSAERYRLVTNILDWQQAPAAELAQLYSARWGIETTYDEIKNHLKLPRHTLRSKRPDLIRQEFWGFILAHFILRVVIHQAAQSNHLDPCGISFQQTVNIVRRKSASAQPFPPQRTGSPSPLG